MKNLFNGDKVLGKILLKIVDKKKNVKRQKSILGEAINDVINNNFDVLSKDIVPLVEKALQKTFKKIGNKIASRYTYSQLFPLT